MTSSATILATATMVATTSPQIQQAPEWVSYIIDIILALVFLFILLFTKSDESDQNKLTPEEMPNELEKVLRTDSENIETSETEDSKPEEQAEEKE